MTEPSFPPVRELVLHEAPMLLLEDVLAFSDDQLVARMRDMRDGLFDRPGFGVPAYVGVEVMAQAICAYDGLVRRQTGAPPALGFLLGCRRYRAACDWFPASGRPKVHVTSLLQDSEMASFECRIYDGSDTSLAEGTLNVFRPNDPEKYLNDQ